MFSATEISEGQLLEDLAPLAAYWRALATQIGISADDQHIIEGEGNRVGNCFQGIIEEWLKGKGPHTKAKLIETLKFKAMGSLNRLAKKISGDKGNILIYITSIGFPFYLLLRYP